MSDTADTTIKHGPHRAETTAPAFEYRPPIEEVCRYCGIKCPGPYSACQACRDLVNRGM